MVTRIPELRKLRNRFAAQAMNGLLAGRDPSSAVLIELLVDESFAIADAMLTRSIQDSLAPDEEDGE